MTIDAGLRQAYRFFCTHAGRVEGEQAAGALRYARAERAVQALPWEFVVEDDDERAYCHCDDPACPYGEASTGDWETLQVTLWAPCPEHGVRCPHARILASLSGIIAPDDNYLRVVRAELALEALAAEAPAAAGSQGVR